MHGRSLQGLVPVALLAAMTGLAAQGTRFGKGCAGSRGTPNIALAGSFAAGGRAAASLVTGPATAPVVLLIGTSDRTSALGPLPFDLSRLPGFGRGCLLLGSSELPVATVANAAGGADISFTMPKLAGARFFVQYLCVDSLRPVRLTMSNALRIDVARPGARVTGGVRSATAQVADARITIFDPSGSLFLETRTDANGRYAFEDVPNGAWRHGVAARGFEYREAPLRVTGNVTLPDVVVGRERNSGRWRVIGSTLPHFLDATDMAVLLPDGRIWFCHDTTDPVFFDPVTGRKEAPDITTKEQGCFNALLLDDGDILVAGGQDGSRPVPVPNKLGIVKYCDLYDPAANAWRRVADMRWFREYHAVTLLVPDGRVVTTGGTVIKFKNPPVTADIEAFEPPYLFRGVRPRITGVSDTTFRRGQQVALTVEPWGAITSAVLVGFGTQTHWVDSGVKRRLVLAVSQRGSGLRFRLPADPNVLPAGHYMLFAMADDIPSRARVIRIR